MQAELSEYADGVRGHGIHANISAIVQFLPEDLGAFSQGHPQVKIDLEEHLSTEVLRGAGRRGRPRHLQRVRPGGPRAADAALPA